jgi:iron complex outermembrane receptor protein
MQLRNFTSFIMGSGMVCTLFSFNNAWAEETVPPVVVSATRSEQSSVTTPSSITVITRDEIDASNATHITDVLRSQADLQVRDLFGDGSRTTISMRGFSGSNAAANVLIMVDGRRLNNPDLQAPDLNSISLKDVERIEIIQGSAGTLFGDQAVGGAINIITRQPGKARTRFAGNVGNYHSTGLLAMHSEKLTNGIDYRVSAERNNSDNYREHNRQQYTNVMANTGYRYGTNRVFLEAQHIAEDLQLPGALSQTLLEQDRRQADPTYPNQYNDSITNIFRAGLSQSLTGNWRMEGELTQRNANLNGIAFTNNIDQHRKHNGFTPRLVGVIEHGNSETLATLGADLDYARYEFSSDSPYLSNINAKQNEQSLYAQAVTTFSPRLETTIGLRYARVDFDITDSFAFPTGQGMKDNVLVKEIGLSSHITPQWRLFLRRDENFRFAKIDENTYTPPGVIGLDTQTGVSYEAGTEWHQNSNRVKFLVYELRLDNEIDFDSTAVGPGSFPGANTNLDPTRRKGMTLEMSTRAAQYLDVSAQFAYVDATFDGGSFDGKAIPFVAAQRAQLSANYGLAQWGLSHWHLFGELQYTGQRYQDSDYSNTLAKLPTLTLLNLAMDYDQKDWRIGARLNNVSNKKYNSYAVYNSYYPAPERNAMLTVTYRME